MIVTRGLGTPGRSLVAAGMGRSVAYRRIRVRRLSAMTRAILLESML